MKRTALFFIFLTFVTSAVLAKSAIDPSRINVGARALGLGRAFSSADNDCTLMYFNPAGLSSVDTWQISSMSSKMLNEIDTNMFGGAVATKLGTLGFGYIGTSLGGIFPTAIDYTSDPAGRFVSLTTMEAMGYKVDQFVFSYGSKLSRFIPSELFNKIDLGASLKLFGQQLSGTGLGDLSASGYDLDLGLRYR